MSFRIFCLSERRRLFHLAVLWVTGLSLWPVWRFRFLPMQDIPQHLFVSYLLSTFDNPSFNWGQTFIVDLKADPYNLFYYTTGFFYLFFDIETSAKLFVSIYIMLVAFLALRASWSLNDHHAPPWGLLLLFPFSFSQIYFLGFTNYLISIPLLFLALLDLEVFVAGPLSIWSALRQVLYQILLFVTHPFTVLLYLGFALAGSFFYRSEGRSFKKALFAPLLLALFFLFWYGKSYNPDGLGPTADWGVSWAPVLGTLGFFMLMFTGMQWTRAVHWPTVMAWLAIMGIFAAGSVIHKRDTIIPWKTVCFLFLSLLGFWVLPFWLSYYSYFNLRIAPVSYFFLAMVLSRIKLGSKAALLLVGLTTLLMVFSANLHGKLSRETAEIMPLLTKMEGNAPVLPVLLDSSAAGLDPAFFYEFHKHDTNYYHIIAGGGATPDLFPNPLFPVRYKPGVTLPMPNDLDPSIVQSYAPYYRYLLVRGAPGHYKQELSLYFNFAGQSGKWSLFESRAGLQ